jgi:hypothetical protein
MRFEENEAERALVCRAEKQVIGTATISAAIETDFMALMYF